MLVGRDPTRIEFLWQVMYRHSFWRLEIIGTTAMSAIEQACWDILGKSLGVPVYRLLGGRVRDRVRMYTHLGMGEVKAVYETFDAGPLIERAHAVIEKGYRALKVVIVPYSQTLTGLPAVRHFASMMQKLREAVGPEIDIMVDFHGRRGDIMRTGVGGSKRRRRCCGRCRCRSNCWCRSGSRCDSSHRSGGRSPGRRQHVSHGQTIGVVGAAVHRDIVAPDIGGVGVGT